MNSRPKGKKLTVIKIEMSVYEVLKIEGVAADHSKITEKFPKMRHIAGGSII